MGSNVLALYKACLCTLETLLLKLLPSFPLSFLHSLLQFAPNLEHRPDMFTGDKAEVINPNRVHEGLNKEDFVCPSVCKSVYVTETEAWPKIVTTSRANTHKGRPFSTSGCLCDTVWIKVKQMRGKPNAKNQLANFLGRRSEAKGN